MNQLLYLILLLPIINLGSYNRTPIKRQPSLNTNKTPQTNKKNPPTSQETEKALEKVKSVLSLPTELLQEIVKTIFGENLTKNQSNALMIVIAGLLRQEASNPSSHLHKILADLNTLFKKKGYSSDETDAVVKAMVRVLIEQLNNTTEVKDIKLNIKNKDNDKDQITDDILREKLNRLSSQEREGLLSILQK